MALSIQDLDQLLQYDPTSHSVAGFPKPRAEGIPSLQLGGTGVGQAANAAKPPDRIPSIGTSTAMAPTAIPKLESVPPPNITPAPAYTPGSTIPSATGEIANVKPKEGFGTKLLHGFEKAGNIAGDVLAPEVMPLIPGTDLNKLWQEKRQAGLAGEQARTGLETAQTEQAKEGSQLVPFTDESGNTTQVPLSKWAPLEVERQRAAEIQKSTETKANAGAQAADKKKQDAIAEGYAKMGYNATFAPDGSIADVQPIQGFKPPASKQDTYHEWLESHPNGTYDDFQKDVQQIKKAAAGPSGMSIYGLSRMMNMAYEMDPRLIPILPSLMKEAGINTSGLNLEGPAPGQPRNEAGNPIGIRMPESPTGATRGR